MCVPSYVTRSGFDRNIKDDSMERKTEKAETVLHTCFRAVARCFDLPDPGRPMNSTSIKN